MTRLAKTLTLPAGLCLIMALPAASQSMNCSQFMAVGSNSVGAGTNLTFTNSTQSIRTVYWMDAAANPVTLVTLNVGESADYMVGPGDVFAMVDGPGNCVEMFRATSGQSQYNISVIATGAGGD